MPRFHDRARVTAALAVAMIVPHAAPASAQGVATSGSDRAGFVTTLGRDTVALESVTRTADRVEGDIAVRVPGTVLCHYVVALASDGSPRQTRVEIRPLAAPGVEPATVTLDFTGDSVRVVSESQGKRQAATRAIARGTFPFFLTGFGASYGLYTAIGPFEAYLPHLPAAIGDTIVTPAIDMANARIGKRRFVRRSATEVDADWFGYFWQHLTVDATGRITAVDARGTTEKTMTERTPFIDVAAAAQRFAQADRAGRGLGAASVDTVARGTVNGKLVVVTYGSPRARGRTILGGVVPYDRVWRTGANAATVLVTDRELTVGGTTLPAGAYSLWTIPKRDGTVTLVINRQHGQWGTDYDPSQDVARVPMQSSTAASPQDRFTIAVAGGTTPQLRMAWDTFVWSVPLR